MSPSRYLTAAEAAQALGISLASLYAYVSRGLIRSEAEGGSRRERRYHRDDVDRLAARQAQRRHPERAGEQALSWGVPVLESALTLIAGGRLYYRGQDAIELAQTSTFEQVAQLLWQGEPPSAGDGSARRGGQTALRPYEPCLKLLPEAAPVERIQAILPLAAMHDAAAHDLRPSAVAQTGGRLLALLAAAAVYPARPAADGIAQALQQGWMPQDARGAGSERAKRLIEAALILSADHELNTSAFAARCVASVRATPYQVVIAGLAALQGARHGGYSTRVETLLDEVGQPKLARPVVEAWLKRGESLPGFGHPLYPDGDPRARALLELTQAARPRSGALALAQAVAAEARALIGDAPTIDFALVVVAQALRLPRGAALTLFALGRTAGWIAQAMEQYQTEAMIRPRARYVGLLPP